MTHALGALDLLTGYAAADCQHMTIEQDGELFSEGGACAGCRDWDLTAGTSRAVLTP